MIVIIDGYNLLKQVIPSGGKGVDLERQRLQFIRQLACYKAYKVADIQDIIVVFDAGPSNHAVRVVKQGIIVVYSGTRSTADDWILDYLTRHKGIQALVITLDRALREGCVQRGADWLSVYDFYSILQKVLLEAAYIYDNENNKSTDESLERYEYIPLDDGDDDANASPMDKLIHTIYESKQPSKDDAASGNDRKGNANQLTKKDKRLQSKIKKLH